jgi:GT2 family glycosyltransferase
MNNAPLLSLVLLSFNKFDTTTGPCLSTLTRAWQTPQTELILVDNGSLDGAAQRCAQFAAEHTQIHFLPLPDNLGFARGMNAGAALARGDWVCLVNSDTLFPPSALQALCRTLEHAPDHVAMLGPVTNAAGNGQSLPCLVAESAQLLGIGEQAMAMPTGLLTPTYRTDFFCVAIRRTAWQQLSGLDPIFGLGYYEDFDFSLRLRAQGYAQAIAEDVFILHVGSSSFSAMGAAQHQLMRKNRALLKQRYPDAKLEHLRVGNAQALQHLVDTAARIGWSAGLRQRAAWRLAALHHNEPRSPFKRWRWRWSTRALRAQLQTAGIHAAFPPLENSHVR